MLRFVQCHLCEIGEESMRNVLVRGSKAGDDVPSINQPLSPGIAYSKHSNRPTHARSILRTNINHYQVQRFCMKSHLRPLLNIGQRMKHHRPILPILHFTRIDGILVKRCLSWRYIRRNRRFRRFVSNRSQLAGSEKMYRMSRPFHLPVGIRGVVMRLHIQGQSIP